MWISGKDFPRETLTLLLKFIKNQLNARRESPIYMSGKTWTYQNYKRRPCEYHGRISQEKPEHFRWNLLKTNQMCTWVETPEPTTKIHQQPLLLETKPWVNTSTSTSNLRQKFSCFPQVRETTQGLAGAAAVTVPVAGPWWPRAAPCPGLARGWLTFRLGNWAC